MIRYYIKYDNNKKIIKHTNFNQINYIKIYNLDNNTLCYNCK